ncbi:alpha/beta fold hydrolase [Culicoidibacter larvae]|uniref:Alpha/beta hydrolase n=1 Tax=Culicoidibacter larvae TaxID=2579976 RepID=A0A5R8QEI7_9FIRM|nr:alpha/beta hydrolase [Culicoidibacter larvae]TLG75386.1 alpha/beta hydrolase [Culicoidibacter larvae]
MAYFEFASRKLFYQCIGDGEPVIFLHGNTASSKMFEFLLPLYTNHFKVILIDFLGNGASERVEHFPVDIWLWQAEQLINFIEFLDCGKVSLVGTSGGAYVAINAALQRPELINKVVADSFSGRKMPDDFIETLTAERTAAKANELSRQYYEWNQGPDWEKIVDMDTAALTQFVEQKHQLYSRPLQELTVPILLIGSQQDELLHGDFTQEYQALCKIIPNAEMYVFPSGGHPSILTNAEKTAELIIDFI